MSVSTDTIFQRKKQNLPQNIKRFLAGADSCAQSGAHDRVLWNLSVVARDSLCAGMLAIRWENDFKAGAAYFSQGAAVADRFLGFAEKGFPAAAWLSHHLIYCALLSNDWQKATALAQWAQGVSDPDPRLTDDESEAFGRLLALFVLDRRGDFSALRQQCLDSPSRELHPFWQWLSLYLDLYQAVLDRDQARFDELMQEREKAYVARSKNKKAGESRPEFGGGEESPFVFDFMGVGLAKLARLRGLKCDFDSEFLPKKVIEA